MNNIWFTLFGLERQQGQLLKFLYQRLKQWEGGLQFQLSAAYERYLRPKAQAGLDEQKAIISLVIDFQSLIVSSNNNDKHYLYSTVHAKEMQPTVLNKNK